MSLCTDGKPATPHPDGPSPEGPLEQVIARRLLAGTPSLLPLAERLAVAAEHDVTVLLTGATGTGKTHLARLIHDCSPRRHGPFVTVPCGALAAPLIESEFFGHVRGAFTGANRDKEGKFTAAGQGTLLLDEVDSLSLDKQAGLLRAVETGEYEPVGSNHTQRSGCRVLAASNSDLKKLMEQGRFRRDLYHRLNVLSLYLPPLGERTEDIAPLARALTARFGARYRTGPCAISPEALTLLECYPWPGNLRELENVIQHAVLLSRGPTVLPRHLPEEVRQHPVLTSCGPGTARSRGELFERGLIQRALAKHACNHSRAARELGISRTTLYKKLRKYGVVRERGGGAMAS